MVQSPIKQRSEDNVQHRSLLGERGASVLRVRVLARLIVDVVGPEPADKLFDEWCRNLLARKVTLGVLCGALWVGEDGQGKKHEASVSAWILGQAMACLYQDSLLHEYTTPTPSDSLKSAVPSTTPSNPHGVSPKQMDGARGNGWGEGSMHSWCTRDATTFNPGGHTPLSPGPGSSLWTGAACTRRRCWCARLRTSSSLKMGIGHHIGLQAPSSAR